MVVNRLDTELDTFFRAQAATGTDQLTVECTEPLRKFVDPVKLQARLDEFAQIKFKSPEIQYLSLVPELETDFVGSLQDETLPRPKVSEKDGFIRVVVSGPRRLLCEWEHATSVIIHNLFATGTVEAYDLDFNTIFGEGVRRLQRKLDLVRNAGVRWVEAGSRYRMFDQFYAMLIPTILGDCPDQLYATTNAWMALSHGITPFSTHAPSLTKDVFDDIIDADVALSKPTFDTALVRAPNAFAMAHLVAHAGQSAGNLLFEWGSDLTADMGAIRGALPLSFHYDG